MSAEATYLDLLVSNSAGTLITTLVYNIMVKQSLYRPGVTQRIPGS